ncbi:hypothetical protein AB834_07540 [PVC group bacterium (ex Bugula neritina AB1)]|nr:hypothetical protein AB834_07540 [PVC group bacterium (ex Bugula neritina AB1)]
MKCDFMGLLRFPFEDKRWFSKILIAALLAMIPVLNFVTVGYLMLVFQSGIRKEERYLPEWSIAGTEELNRANSMVNLFILGVIGTLSFLVYVIPIMALTFISFMIAGLGDFLNYLGGALVVLGYILGIGVAICCPFVIGTYLETGEIREILYVKNIWNKFYEVKKEALTLYAAVLSLSMLSMLMNAYFPPFFMVLTVPLTILLAIVLFRGFGEIYPSKVQEISEEPSSLNAMADLEMEEAQKEEDTSSEEYSSVENSEEAEHVEAEVHSAEGAGEEEPVEAEVHSADESGEIEASKDEVTSEESLDPETKPDEENASEDKEKAESSEESEKE